MDNTENRQLQNIKTLQAPPALVWKAWTDPQHIIKWWGPAGFTTTVHTMDLKQQGEWRLTLHAPDGTNYPNRSIFKEIIPERKIVFEHFNPHFITTVIFEPQNDDTLLNWTMVFDTPEMFDIIVKAHKADEGQKQNIERLENHLAIMRG